MREKELERISRKNLTKPPRNIAPPGLNVEEEQFAIKNHKENPHLKEVEKKEELSMKSH